MAKIKKAKKVKICVIIDAERRKEAIRLCRRLGKVKKAMACLILEIRRVPPRKVLRFLEAQPFVAAAHRIVR